MNRQDAVEALFGLLLRGRRSSRQDMAVFVDAIVETALTEGLLQPDPRREAQERARWRRHIASDVLQGMMANTAICLDVERRGGEQAQEAMVSVAVRFADLLLAELDRTAPTEAP